MSNAAENDASRCPECGGIEWSTASDGLGNVASVAAVCLSCRYVRVSVVDLGSVIPPGNPDSHEWLGMDR